MIPLVPAACALALFTAPPQVADASGSSAEEAAVDEGWPQFRGPAAAGVADEANPPMAFDAPTWRVPIAGLAHASPVAVDGRVFVATAVPLEGDAELKVGLYGDGDSANDLVDTEFRLVALDTESGEVQWDVLVARTVPQFGRHTKATQANSTPAVSGSSVVALFGPAGLFCFDVETGERRWRVDLGPLDCGPWNSTDLEWGFASSPVIADGLVVVQADVKESPFLAAFDLETGEERWRVSRDDVNGWSTPTIARTEEGEALVLVNGCKHMGAYSLADGAERWRLSGGGGIPVPTPVVSGEHVIFTSNHRPLVASHPQKPVFAVRLDAKGDLGVPDPKAEGGLPEGVAWLVDRRGNYMQTPLVYRDLVWLCYDSGVLTCLDAATGEEHFRERIHPTGEGFTASPLGAGGRVYLFSETGQVVVLAARPELDVLAHGEVGEVCMATPAIVGDALIVRTQGHLVRFDPKP